MTDYLRRLERLEEQLGPRRCERPCVKCAILALPCNNSESPKDPRDFCDRHPQTLDEMLAALPPLSGIRPAGER